jgi:uncharacterized RDD family membrane protein YckC
VIRRFHEADPDQRYQTFWRRFAAGIVDGVIFIPLGLADSWIWDHVAPGPILVPWLVAYSMSYFLYSVLLHGRYGQTLGKRLLGVKVFDVSGAKLSMRQAFLRDSVWIALTLYGLVNDVSLVIEGKNPYDLERGFDVALLVSLFAGGAWFILELVTMLTNRKRRAVHDFIAGSVVMRVDRAPRVGNASTEPT